MYHEVCQLCLQRPASVHITDALHDGSVHTLHICHHCLVTRDLEADQSLPPVQSFQAEMPIEQPTEVQTGTSGRSEADLPPCPRCGLSLGAFRQDRQFGCAHDLDHFGEEVIELLEQIHGASHHIGRGPGKSGAATVNRQVHKQVLLQKELDQAIAEEDYERAAQLRDALKELEP